MRAYYTPTIAGSLSDINNPGKGRRTLTESHYQEAPFSQYTDASFNSIVICINVQTNQIAYLRGVKRYLGFEESSFTTEQLKGLAHPSHSPFVLANAKAIRKLIHCHPRFKKIAGNAWYKFIFAMRKRDGSFILLLHTGIISHFDADHNPLIEYNRYYILAHHHTSDSIIQKWAELSLVTGKRLPVDEKILHSEAEQYLRQQAIEGQSLNFLFSKKQLDILEYLNEGFSTPEICDATKITTSTYYTHRRNIRDKGKQISTSLDKAEKVAAFLKERGII